MVCNAKFGELFGISKMIVDEVAVKTEIYNAICEMKNGKTPGPDGISVEFYKKIWHIIGDDFAMFLNKFVNCRQEIEWKSFKQAHITLIYKKSDLLT